MSAVLPPVDAGLAEEVDPAAVDSLEPLRQLAAQPAIAQNAPDAEERPVTTLILSLLRAGAVDLSDIGVSPVELAAAAEDVASSAPFRDAAAAPDDRLMDATIRSVVARALERSPDPEGIGLPSPQDVSILIGRGAAQVAHVVLGGVGSLLGNVAGSGIGDAVKLELSRRIARQRLDLMRKNILVAADVLAYQRLGAGMRECVAREIKGCEPPVVALGHSLGGIMLVDTLFGPNAAPTACKLLVTFGSQSALLAAIGAIEPVTPSVPWINVWTKYDFVSFIVGKIWPDAQDVPVVIDVGFPDSHGKYYETDAFYAAFRDHDVVRGILADGPEVS